MPTDPISAFVSRLKTLLHRNRLDRDLDDELAFHLAMRKEEQVGRGLPTADADVAARRQFGNVLRVKEHARDAWMFTWLESVGQDVRFALRGLRRASGFSSLAVLALAVGIGGSTAVFSVVNATMLRPLPYDDANNLVRIVENVPPEESPSSVANRTVQMNEDAYLWWRDHSTTLSAIEAILATPVTAQVAGENIRLTAAQVTPSLFATFGASAVSGRLLTPLDAGSHVTVLAAAASRRLVASNAPLVGRTIVIDRVAYEIVGIVADDFAFPSPHTDVWMPYAVQPSPNRLVAVDVVGRLRDGVSLKAASSEANALGALLRGEPPANGLSQPPRFEVVGLQDHLIEPVRPALRVLIVTVILVLMNVCANVANMLSARSSAREREFAIRSALGAGQGRVTRLLLTESVVMSAVGGLAGVGLAFGGVAALKWLAVINLPGLYGGDHTLLPGIERVEVDGAVLGFALIVTASSALLFAVLPALDISRIRGMATTSRLTGSGVTPSGRRIRHALGMGQIGLATVLLVGAGLLMRSFVKLAGVEIGYEPASTLTFELVLPEQLPEARKLALANELAARLSAAPGILAAGFTSAAPLSILNGGWAITPPGVAPDQLLGRPGLRVGASSVSSDYLRAIGVQLLQGRWLGANHGLDAPPAVLVNNTLARQFFGDETALGRAVIIGGRTWRVVGVVEDVRSTGLSFEPEPRAYLDHDRLVADGHDAGWDKFAPIPTPRFLSFAARVNRPPLAMLPEVRRIVSGLEPLAAVDGAVAMSDVVSGALARPRFYAALVGLFAAAAVVIAAVGIYGVLSFAVARRTQEIGIRVALGATPGDVIGIVARDAGVMIGLGIAIGLGVAIAVTRYLQAMLFGVMPLDLPTFVAVPLVCGSVAAIAAYVPARRATRVDPIVALRCE